MVVADVVVLLELQAGGGGRRGAAGISGFIKAVLVLQHEMSD